MPDVVIVGGGVIGLSTAYELSKRGATVAVLDQSEIGTEASWAGAGMLPPAQLVGTDAVKELQRRSHSRWPILSAELLELTGIDNGYHNSGAIQVQLQSEQDLAHEVAGYQQQDIPVEPLDANQLQHLEPAISSDIVSGYHLPTMSQVRNPWHLKALAAGCLKHGVTFHPRQAVMDWTVSKSNLNSNSRVEAAVTSNQSFTADQFVVTAGAWTSQLLTRFKIDLHIEPVRGQIVLLKVPDLPFTHIIECGPQYLVPRHDGRILIGSTEEQTGFNKANTPIGIASLLNFATTLIPALKDATIERNWSGLRPYSQSGPYIGRCPANENLYIAAGHFRNGLSQSPETSLQLSEMINTDRF